MQHRILVLLLLLGSQCIAQKHVVLISIDGLRPEMYRDASWPAPNLRALMKEGVYAEHVLSVFPAYTYPAHTAMVTGQLPAKTGIVHNVKDSAGKWYWFASDIRVKTLWEMCAENGLRTAALMWPVTAGARIDYNWPEIWDRAGDKVTAARKYATPGLIEAIERKATGELDSVNMNETNFSLDENVARAAAFIFKTHAPSLLAVHFVQVDGMQHKYGREHDSVRLALANADHAVGIIRESITQSRYEDSTTIIVVGDHGMSDIHEVLRPNILLQGMHVRFNSSGGSSFLYPMDAVGIDGSEIEKYKAIEKLDALPDSVKRMFSVMDRKELDELGADKNAILALSALPGVVFSNATGPTLVAKTKGGHHGYDPRLPEMWTGLIAAGAGIEKGKVITEMKLTEIAGMIAQLLQIKF